MTEFGSVLEDVPRPVEDLAPGDHVRVIAGRHRGATAELVRIDRVPTPSSSTAVVALIRRPRAGESYVFPHELARIE